MYQFTSNFFVYFLKIIKDDKRVSLIDSKILFTQITLFLEEKRKVHHLFNDHLPLCPVGDLEQ